ncbi:ABC transporter ATP-binding protein [Paenibacillus sp. GCM10023252]|uniref:ABC transporter ATP-binding protein n=1 Tax=Paenibacillus sp. GCM10023252 TaxID=3252649 RepID=UPI00361B5B8B
MDRSQYAIEMIDIHKVFGEIAAADGVSFRVLAGEIHALLGENGAGKSTLMSILFGVYRPDSGIIKVNGSEVKIRSPKEAAKRRIGMVHQHFKLVPALTALENIVLGDPSGWRNLWNGATWRERKTAELSALCERYALVFPLHRPVWQLSVGEQQRIEIMKTLYRSCDIIVLDEPTAVLTPSEVEDLLATLKELKSSGKTVILTTHKLKEVMSSCDRISVMRRGKMIRTVTSQETEERELAEMIMGREVIRPTDSDRKPSGDELLRITDLSAKGDHGQNTLSGFSLSLQRGEVLGIAGVAGNGQKELAEIIAGLRPWQGGEIQFDGESLAGLSVQQIIERGIAHIPENRMRSGMAGSLSAVDNLLMKSYARPSRSRGGFMKRAGNRSWAERMVEQFEVRTPGIDTEVRMLSGGNQQKLLFARELDMKPLMLMAVHPTQGLDVGAAGVVHKLLMELRNSGSGVLLISEDLDEMMHLADRIVVIYNGRIQGQFIPGEASRTDIGLLMTGMNSIQHDEQHGEQQIEQQIEQQTERKGKPPTHSPDYYQEGEGA